jgi:hypothetical protein
MDRYRNDEWFPALLTASSFLTTLFTWVFACLDALDGSPWYEAEFLLGFASGLAFVSLLAQHE